MNRLLPEILAIRSKFAELREEEHQIQLRCKHEADGYQDRSYDGKDIILYNCDLCDFYWIKEL